MLAVVLFVILDLLEIIGYHNAVYKVSREKSDLNHIEDSITAQKTLIDYLCLPSRHAQSTQLTFDHAQTP